MEGQTVNALLYGIGGAVIAAVSILAWQRVVRTYRRYRGTMVVRCPETGKPVGVRVDAGHAAKTAA